MRGRSLDVCGARADLAGLATGERPGAVDRGHGPAYRLHRPGAAGMESRARLQDPRGRAFQRPDNPFVLFNLGAIAVERQDWSTALGHLQRSLRGSALTDSIVRKLFALIARCHHMLGDLARGLERLFRGTTDRPRRRRAAFPQGRPAPQGGQPAEAEACWRRVLTLKHPDQFCSVEQGIYGHLTLRNLAVLAERTAEPGGSGGWSSTPARATPRPCREGNVTVSRGASRQRSATRCPRLQPERSHSIPPAPLRK